MVKEEARLTERQRSKLSITQPCRSVPDLRDLADSIDHPISVSAATERGPV
jgi:hypothetical protein